MIKSVSPSLSLRSQFTEDQHFSGAEIDGWEELEVWRALLRPLQSSEWESIAGRGRSGGQSREGMGVSWHWALEPWCWNSPAHLGPVWRPARSKGHSSGHGPNVLNLGGVWVCLSLPVLCSASFYRVDIPYFVRGRELRGGREAFPLAGSWS